MDQPVRVDDLLADPTRFDHQTITAVGFYVNEREHHAMYASPDDVGTPSRAVWLTHESSAGGNAKPGHEDSSRPSMHSL